MSIYEWLGQICTVVHCSWFDIVFCSTTCGHLNTSTMNVLSVSPVPRTHMIDKFYVADKYSLLPPTRVVCMTRLLSFSSSCLPMTHRGGTVVHAVQCQYISFFQTVVQLDFAFASYKKSDKTHSQPTPIDNQLPLSSFNPPLPPPAPPHTHQCLE